MPVFLYKKRNNNEYHAISDEHRLDEDKAIRQCFKLEGLQVETSTFNYKVVRPIGGISKSVSPDSTVIIF
jgi:hypothetical protein